MAVGAGGIWPLLEMLLLAMLLQAVLAPPPGWETPWPAADDAKREFARLKKRRSRWGSSRRFPWRRSGSTGRRFSVPSCCASMA